MRFFLGSGAGAGAGKAGCLFSAAGINALPGIRLFARKAGSGTAWFSLRKQHEPKGKAEFFF
ncbi:hypothetical protein CUB89_09705 [Akkermansia muciniphila]|nr:hypothetical protein CUB89_09705 [Akkermansia muciniphila]